MRDLLGILAARGDKRASAGSGHGSVPGNKLEFRLAQIGGNLRTAVKITIIRIQCRLAQGSRHPLKRHPRLLHCPRALRRLFVRGTRQLHDLENDRHQDHQNHDRDHHLDQRESRPAMTEAQPGWRIEKLDHRVNLNRRKVRPQSQASAFWDGKKSVMVGQG